jgi:glycosyltransferase involved in cell wall biosynthesis
MRLLICTQVVDKNDPIMGFFHRWIEEFAKHNESVTVLCLMEGEHSLPDNVHVHSLGKEGGESRIKYVWNFYFHILSYYFKYDTVFVHMNPEYVILGGLFWKLGRKRTVLWYTHKSVTRILKLATYMVDVVCTASKESFRLSSKNVVVTGHGIDLDVFSIPKTQPADHLRIVTIGRISRSKNIHIMLETISKLPHPYSFPIVGEPITVDDKKYQKELLEQIKRLHIDKFVTLKCSHSSKEVASIFAESDVFLHASDTGSLDKAALEAMAERCIVVSSNDAVRPIVGRVNKLLAVESPDPELFTNAVQKVRQLKMGERTMLGERLRGIVMNDHSLMRLINKLQAQLEG